MSEPGRQVTKRDVVAELDRWLAAHSYDGPIRHESVQRARDEIVALREELRSPTDPQMHFRMEDEAARRIRAKALEEAARECFRCFGGATPERYAAAIRALKDAEDIRM